MDKIKDISTRIYHQCENLLPDAEKINPVRDYEKFLNSLYISCELNKSFNLTFSFLKQKIKQADGIISASQINAKVMVKKLRQLLKSDKTQYDKDAALLFKTELQNYRLQMKYVKEIKASLQEMSNIIKEQKASNQSRLQKIKQKNYTMGKG